MDLISYIKNQIEADPIHSFDEKSRLCVRAILGPAAADHPKGSPNTVCTAPGAAERYFDAGRGKTVEDAYVIVLHW